jgi:hypothetical protein
MAAKHCASSTSYRAFFHGLGRLWTYVRDERCFAGERPPAALFCYSQDRKGVHPRDHLRDFRGVIHADGYAGFNQLFAGNRITEAACWAHPWTAPASARQNPVSPAIEVVCSHPFGLASRRAGRRP